MFGMQNIISATPGQGSALAEILLSASQLMCNVDGCKLYIVQQSLTSPDDVLITEVWSDQDCQRASLNNENIRTLIESAKPIIASMTPNPANYLGGHGL